MQCTTRLARPAILVACTLLLAASAAQARKTPEQKCQKARYDAAAKYEACQQKVMGKFLGGAIGEGLKFLKAVGKCAVKYQATWPKLQKKALGTGAPCDAARFVDNGTTVTDNLTLLQWEKKTDDESIHDKDSTHSWSTSGEAADGDAFTNFLRTLNGDPCLAGECDWRLPTVAELQTILLEPSWPCPASPCIDPIFGPTAAAPTWSSTINAHNLDYAWTVSFSEDNGRTSRFKAIDHVVRAVRGGL